jgi:hypothetical protein
MTILQETTLPVKNIIYFFPIPPIPPPSLNNMEWLNNQNIYPWVRTVVSWNNPNTQSCSWIFAVNIMWFDLIYLSPKCTLIGRYGPCIVNCISHMNVHVHGDTTVLLLLCRFHRPFCPRDTNYKMLTDSLAIWHRGWYRWVGNLEIQDGRQVIDEKLQFCPLITMLIIKYHKNDPNYLQELIKFVEIYPRL